jgi:hypothetical protein
MEVSFKSRTNKDIIYSFSDTSSEGLVKSFPHLADNFSFDPSNPVNEAGYIKVINDCAHPEIQAAMKVGGLEVVTRFIGAFGIKAQPFHVYRINQRFYKQNSAD